MELLEQQYSLVGVLTQAKLSKRPQQFYSVTHFEQVFESPVEPASSQESDPVIQWQSQQAKPFPEEQLLLESLELLGDQQ
jgi:hypothetical protein